jgi:5-methylcytosine-specific restriction enzyme A
MLEQVAEALELLGWVEGAGMLLPEEVAAASEPLIEGSRYRVLVSAYERDPKARRRCIEAHGTTCSICGFSFGAVYGDVAEGFIHIHHLRPLSEVDEAHSVDPIKDLRPVCPNCHAVLHRRVPAFSIEDVQGFLAQQIQSIRATSTTNGHN